MSIEDHPLFVNYQGDIEELRAEFDIRRESLIIFMENQFNRLAEKMDLKHGSRFMNQLREYLIPEN